MNVNKMISREEIFKEKPERCDKCGGQCVEYWGETEQEIVFQCQECKKFFSLPFDSSRLHFYFTF